MSVFSDKIDTLLDQFNRYTGTGNLIRANGYIADIVREVVAHIDAQQSAPAAQEPQQPPEATEASDPGEMSHILPPAPFFDSDPEIIPDEEDEMAIDDAGDDEPYDGDGDEEKDQPDLPDLPTRNPMQFPEMDISHVKALWTHSKGIEEAATEEPSDGAPTRIHDVMPHSPEDGPTSLPDETSAPIDTASTETAESPETVPTSSGNHKPAHKGRKTPKS